jgi:hypothetical protein
MTKAPLAGHRAVLASQMPLQPSCYEREREERERERDRQRESIFSIFFDCWSHAVLHQHHVRHNLGQENLVLGLLPNHLSGFGGPYPRESSKPRLHGSACQASCTSKHNQKSELMERASTIQLYTSTAPLEHSHPKTDATHSFS